MREPLRDKARIELMLDNIANAKRFTAGMTLKDFESDLLVVHAVAYNIQSIGEAVYKLSTEFKENHSNVEWKLIAGMRHILVHDYYRVSPSELWMVVQNDIDNLKRELECFLEEF